MPTKSAPQINSIEQENKDLKSNNKENEPKVIITLKISKILSIFDLVKVKKNLVSYDRDCENSHTIRQAKISSKTSQTLKKN